MTREAALLDRRLQAWIIDHLLLGLPLAVLVAAGRPAGRATLLVAAAVLLAVVWVGAVAAVARTGTTPGRRLAGLRVVDADTGRPLGFGRALYRSVLLVPAVVPTLGIGAAVLAWTAISDPRRRAWQDRRTGSIVLDLRTPVAPVGAEPEPLPEPEPVPEAVPDAVSEPAPEPEAAPPSGAGAPLDPAPIDLTALTPTPSTGWRLLVDTGEDVAIEARTLVGRDPEPRDEPVARCLALGSEDLSLSQTHAALEPTAGGGLVVSDRDSTNGTFVVRGDDAQRVGREPVPLREGDVLRCGDRAMRVRRRA